MYGINARLPRAHFKCAMCHIYKVQDVYIWGNFAIPPEHPYEELRICKRCAIREHGRRNSTPLNEMTRMEDKEDG